MFGSWSKVLHVKAYVQVLSMQVAYTMLWSASAVTINLQSQ